MILLLFRLHYEHNVALAGFDSDAYGDLGLNVRNGKIGFGWRAA